MKDKDRKISRSKQQSIQKYVPHGFADFDLDGYYITGRITNWRTDLSLSENKKRIAFELTEKLASISYPETTGYDMGNYRVINMQNFINDLKEHREEAFNIYKFRDKPNSFDNRENEQEDIYTILTPYVFYCRKCRVVHLITKHELSEFHSSLINYKYYKNKTFNPKIDVCLDCGGALSQQQIIRTSYYGDAFDHIPFCDIHKEKTTYRIANGIFNYNCSECSKTLRPPQKNEKLVNALDPSAIYPQLISILDTKEDDTIEELRTYKYLSRLTILWFMGEISDEKYLDLKKRLLKLLNEHQEVSDFLLARNGLKVELDKIKEPRFDEFSINNPDPYYLNIVSKLIDIKEIKDNTTVSYEELLNTLKAREDVNFNNLDDNIEKTLIEEISISENVPITNILYGYTRLSPDAGYELEKTAILNVYKEKDFDNKYRFYSNKLLTEGVYIKFNSNGILKWMVNNITTPDGLSYLSKIDKFDNLSYFNNYLTSSKHHILMDTILHTISHIIMKELSAVAGIEISSMSELIFSEVSSIFIYATSSEGIVLNSIKTAILNRLDILLKKALNSINKCSLKAVCDRKEVSACLGCIYFDEISCAKFNKDLNRKLLSGHNIESEIPIMEEKDLVIKKGLWL